MGDFYDQKKIILVTFGIILLISAFFLPTVVFYPAKVISITPDAEVVGASAWSMLLGIGGTVMLAVALFVPAMIERQLKAWLLSAAVALIGLSAIVMSLGDYYYSTSEGFTYNSLLSLQSSTYSWEDFDRIEERLSNAGGTNSIDSLAYYFRDGEMVEFSGGRILEVHNSIAARVAENGGEVEKVQIE